MCVSRVGRQSWRGGLSSTERVYCIAYCKNGPYKCEQVFRVAFYAFGASKRRGKREIYYAGFQ